MECATHCVWAAFSACSNDISGWDTMTRSTRIGIGIGHCVHSYTHIGLYRCVPVSSILYWTCQQTNLQSVKSQTVNMWRRQLADWTIRGLVNSPTVFKRHICGDYLLQTVYKKFQAVDWSANHHILLQILSRVFDCAYWHSVFSNLKSDIFFRNGITKSR